MRKMSAVRVAFAAAAAACILAACGGPNRNEREADRITRAVIADNMSPVVSDFDAKAQLDITRVRVAELSDELNAQGAYGGLKEDDTWCRTGYVCFDVHFAKRPYYEWMSLDSHGKVSGWQIRSTRPV